MAGIIETPVAIVNKIDWKFVWKVLVAIIIILVLLLTVYWWRYLRGVSWKNIKALVGEEAKKYAKPAEIERMLLQGVRDILADPGTLIQARTYSKTSGIAMDRVLVNNAIAMAKDFEYLPVQTVA